MTVFGIFDSGVGGLTVFRQFIRFFPDESVLYFGDTARMPYGEKSKSQIIKFNEEIISFLIEKGAQIILMGCNTSSSIAIERDRKIFNVPILGLIEPLAKKVGQISRNKKIGVLATSATVKSKMYSKKIKKFWNDCQVFEVACPKLVPFVEAGKLDGKVLEQVVSEYLRPLLKKSADTVIYGCTHYPFLGKIFRKVIGDKNINFVDPAYYLLEEAKTKISKNQVSQKTIRKFYTTGKKEDFYIMCQKLMGDIIKKEEIFEVASQELKNSRERFLKSKN